jgi:N-acetylglutamate synthase-like GNAT family acetyltransferase
MSSTITYRQGNLDDLTKLKFAPDLPATSASVEFNVVGMGHEFWIAVDRGVIVALTVLARATARKRTILYLHVSDSCKNLGIGSALIRAVLDAYPESEFSVIPFEGTEEFYARLGFTKSGKWEMRKTPTLQSD